MRPVYALILMVKPHTVYDRECRTVEPYVVDLDEVSSTTPGQLALRSAMWPMPSSMAPTVLCFPVKPQKDPTRSNQVGNI